MLLSFSAENFRSIKEEQTLSLVSHNRFAEHPEHGVTIPGTERRILPFIIFYGANASGKSNFTKAIRFALKLILRGTNPKSAVPYDPFRLAESDQSPSKFEFRFLSENKVYGYGFEATAEEIKSEWLDLYEGEKPKILFERAVTEKGAHQVEVSAVLKEDSVKVAALSKIGVRRNQLFLSGIRETIDSEEAGNHISNVLSWVSNVIFVHPGPPNSKALSLVIAKEPNLIQFIDSYLKEAETGIHHLRAAPISIENRVNETKLADYKKQIKENPGSLISGELDNGEPAFMALDENGGLVTYELNGCHPSLKGEEIRISFDDESDGTQRLIELLPALHMVGSSKAIFIIDEIDRSLHPLLVKKYIESFLRLNKGQTTQLIVTTHETHLLDLDLLRRDEIWFTEKDATGATHIYPLAEFPVRNDLKIDKGYLQGRFGAIPFLGRIDSIVISDPLPTS